MDKSIDSDLIRVIPFNKNSDGLQLCPIQVKEEYLKKWNEISRDFVCLTKNGELISNSLYRLGGLNFNLNLKKDRYFMLLKHVEAFYPDTITKVKDRKPHLESRWVILDKNGIEKVEFKQFASPYLVKDSCIYSIDGKYYNIETGEFYCDSRTSMKSSDYIFLENAYDKDESKRGVMKINKNDGTWELFK